MRNSFLIIDNNTEREKFIKAYSPMSKVTTMKWKDAIELEDDSSFTAVFIVTDDDNQRNLFIPRLVLCFPACTIIEWRLNSDSEEIITNKISIHGSKIGYVKLFLKQVNDISIQEYLYKVEVYEEIRAYSRSVKAPHSDIVTPIKTVPESLIDEAKITHQSMASEKNPKSSDIPTTATTTTTTTDAAKIKTIQIQSSNPTVSITQAASITVVGAATKSSQLQTKSDAKAERKDKIDKMDTMDKRDKTNKSSVCIIC